MFEQTSVKEMRDTHKLKIVELSINLQESDREKKEVEEANDEMMSSHIFSSNTAVPDQSIQDVPLAEKMFAENQ